MIHRLAKSQKVIDRCNSRHHHYYCSLCSSRQVLNTRFIIVTFSAVNRYAMASIPNVYTHRKVADTASKACEICYKPSTSVLVTAENKVRIGFLPLLWN